MEKKRKADWKPATVPNDFRNEDIAGLLGFEELNDYNINDKVINFSHFEETGKRTKNHVEKPSKKIKMSEEQSVDLNNGQIVTQMSVSKQARKKTKVRSKPGKSHLEERHLQLGVDKIKKLSTSKVSTVNASQNDTHLFNKWGESQNQVHEEIDAWSSFKLSPAILQALSQLGFKKPTEIQEKTLHALMRGRRDILGAAETGSGKTLAFGIPIIQGILQKKKSALKKLCRNVNVSDESDLSSNEGEQKFSETDKNSEDKKGNSSIVESEGKNSGRLFALVLTPTRELAIQVKNHISAIAKFTGIKVAVIVGGLAPQKQERLLKGAPEIIVATPGRLWEMIQKRCEHLQQVNDISFLAIDETDRMLEKGHFEELQTLLKLINKDASKKHTRQNFVFSATLTIVHQLPKHIADRSKTALITPGQKLGAIITTLGVSHPEIVDITQNKGTASTLLEARIVCKLSQKDIYLYYFILRHPGRTLVFCNSIACVRRLHKIFDNLKCRTYPLHAEMQQRQRLKNLEHFRDDAKSLLLATDVAARGLDIPDVQHVIHFQVPRTVEGYVHRSGRTARAKKEGLTVLIMEPKEVNSYLKLCCSLGRADDLPDFPVDTSIFSAAKIRVSLAVEIDKLEHAARKNNFGINWFQNAAKAADILIDEDEFIRGYDDEERANLKRQVIGLRKQLQNLLSQTVLPSTVSVKCLNINEMNPDGTEEAIEILKNRKKSLRVNLQIK